MSYICLLIKGNIVEYLRKTAQENGAGKSLLSHKSELRELVTKKINFEYLTNRNFSIFCLPTREVYVVGRKDYRCLKEIIRLLKPSDSICIARLIETSESRVSEARTLTITLITWSIGSLWGKFSELVNLPLSTWLLMSVLSIPFISLWSSAEKFIFGLCVNGIE